MSIHLLVLGDHNPAFLTHRAIDAAIGQFPAHVQARWVATDSDEALHTERADAVWVVPGSPYRNEQAVYQAIRSARESGQPFLGTCAGFQYTVLEFARNVAGIGDADHAETAPDAERRVVDRLTCSLVGEERTVTAVPGTRIHALCGSAPFPGFHWCNYGLAPSYVERLTQHGLVVSAHSDDAGVEAVELPQHPFFIATLFQPQMAAFDGQPLHPLIMALLMSAQSAGTVGSTSA